MEPATPLVSIAITTYNRAHLVGRALDSALHQTYRNLDIVVVDDGSTDHTSLVLQQYAAKDARIRIVVLATNQGVNAAKNKALDCVSGEFATLLDSDDELLPEAIAAFITLFSRFGPDYGMMVCNAVNPDTGDWTGIGPTQDCDLSYQDAICGRLRGDFTGVWRTSVLGDLRFAADEAAREDSVWHQIYQRSKVRYTHTVLRKYYCGTPDSVLAVRLDKQSAQRKLAAARSYLGRFGADIARCCPGRLSALHREIVLHAGLAGRPDIALNSAIKAVRYRPALANWPLIAVALLPRFAFVQVARRHFAASRAKIAAVEAAPRTT